MVGSQGGESGAGESAPLVFLDGVGPPVRSEPQGARYCSASGGQLQTIPTPGNRPRACLVGGNCQGKCQPADPPPKGAPKGPPCGPPALSEGDASAHRRGSGRLPPPPGGTQTPRRIRICHTGRRPGASSRGPRAGQVPHTPGNSSPRSLRWSSPGPCAGPPPVPALVLAARAAGCPSWLLGAGRQPWTPHPTSLLPLLTRTRVAGRYGVRRRGCARTARPGRGPLWREAGSTIPGHVDRPVCQAVARSARRMTACTVDARHWVPPLAVGMPSAVSSRAMVVSPSPTAAAFAQSGPAPGSRRRGR